MIHLENVSRIFHVGDQDVYALADVNLEVDRGEYMAVTGPSGSGKSTLLNIIGLLDHATSGRYFLEGRDVTTLIDHERATIRREKIGFVFQFFHLVPRLNAKENVELPLVLSGVPPSERAHRSIGILESVGLGGRMHHRPDQLSAGQRQRVAIARAVIMNPSLLLADEPTGNLDRASGREVLDLLEGMNSAGITLIMVTHDMEIGARAQRRIHIVDGRIVQDEAG